ncbi:MAG: hypothetical protein JXA90_12560 [Planctomycetes bacterium]|nr:hypothetical protein [Planctomycetota bacterium]
MARESGILIERVRFRYHSRAASALDASRLSLAELGEFVEAVCGRWERSAAWIEEHFAGLREQRPVEEAAGSAGEAAALWAPLEAAGASRGGGSRAEAARGTISAPGAAARAEASRTDIERRPRDASAAGAAASPARAGGSAGTDLFPAGEEAAVDLAISAGEARIAEDVFGPLGGSDAARRGARRPAGDIAGRPAVAGALSPLAPPAGREMRGPPQRLAGGVPPAGAEAARTAAGPGASVSWFVAEDAGPSAMAGSIDDDPQRRALDEWRARGF